MRFQQLWIWIHTYYIWILFFWILCYICLKKISATAKKVPFWGTVLLEDYLKTTFLIYLSGLLYVTLCRYPYDGTHYNLSFLWEYKNAFLGSPSWFWQIGNNIMAFVPLGIFFGEFYSRFGKKENVTWYQALLFGAFISFLIESAQFVFGLGLFELDDLLNNSIGMLLGYGIFKACAGILHVWDAYNSSNKRGNVS